MEFCLPTGLPRLKQARPSLGPVHLAVSTIDKWLNHRYTARWPAERIIHCSKDLHWVGLFDFVSSN